MANTIVNKSVEFLKSVLMNEKNLSDYFSTFTNYDPRSMEKLTNTEKLIFWVNIYNALMQIELRTMDGTKVNKAIFVKKIFKVAGEEFSLDNIEHGLIRKNKSKYSLGYLRGFQLNLTTKKWMCTFLEARIHFLLNCGAESCPVIRVLTDENVEIELHEAEKDFILSETDIDHTKKTIAISALFLFYRKDFGGKAGISKLIQKYWPYPSYSLIYKKWNWKIKSLKMNKL